MPFAARRLIRALGFYSWAKIRLGMSMNRFLILAVSMIALAFCGCSSSPMASQSASSSETRQSNESKQSNVSHSAVDLLTEYIKPDSPLGTAWRRFIADGRYRLIRPEEFTFSEAAKKQLAYTIGSNWAFHLEHPYQAWDIEYDGGSDFVAIVADNTRNDAARFGLVIFRELKNKKGYEEPRWLWQERDLSKRVILFASTTLYMRDYLDDGTIESCEIKWNQRRQIYECG
jgi:hypothetical protein